jgi:hypothetical protein
LSRAQIDSRRSRSQPRAGSYRACRGFQRVITRGGVESKSEFLVSFRGGRCIRLSITRMESATSCGQAAARLWPSCCQIRYTEKIVLISSRLIKPVSVVRFPTLVPKRNLLTIYLNLEQGEKMTMVQMKQKVVHSKARVARAETSCALPGLNVVTH